VIAEGRHRAGQSETIEDPPAFRAEKFAAKLVSRETIGVYKRDTRSGQGQSQGKHPTREPRAGDHHIEGTGQVGYGIEGEQFHPAVAFRLW
jgi:hypothetical protein